MTRTLLKLGIAVPIVYFATLLVASLTWPGYSHVTQYASELGSAAAPYPWIFNVGIVATGIAGLAGSLGVARTLAAEGRRTSGALAGVALAAWSVGMLFGGVFPMPNPLHNGFGLVLALPLVPPLLAVALRGRAGRGLRLFLLAWFVATAALLAVMFGAGALVTRANVGLWQRALAVAMIPGIGVACAALLRRSRSD